MRLPVAEAVPLLTAPDAAETFSPLAGHPLVVLALDEGPDPTRAAGSEGSEECTTLARALTELPCVSVALGSRSPDAGAVAATVADACDLRVADAAELARVDRRVRACPLAALALVQVLRHNARASIADGLWAESLTYSTLQAGPEFAAWLAGRGPSRRASRSRPPDCEPEGPAVRVRRAGDTLRITLARPDRHNALSVELRDALVEALSLAAADRTIATVHLEGEGPSFCSGGDLDEFGTHPDAATAHAVRSIRSPARWMAACADRVHVRVHGACIGAGVELPAFAAHVTAAPDACFELPELAMGLVPGAGGTVSLPRRIGRQRSAWLALTGARLDAETALAWGLVDEIA